jgi:hypothetical protein
MNSHSDEANYEPNNEKHALPGNKRRHTSHDVFLVKSLPSTSVPCPTLAIFNILPLFLPSKRERPERHLSHIHTFNVPTCDYLATHSPVGLPTFTSYSAISYNFHSLPRAAEVALPVGGLRSVPYLCCTV